MNIRLATRADIREIQKVGRAAHLQTYTPLIGKESVERGLNMWWSDAAISAAINRKCINVAEVAGEVVGVCEIGTHHDEPTIWKLYVLPEWQGKGVGSLLMQHAMEAIGPNHQRIVIEHMAGNERAARFYARHGFREYAREPADAYGAGYIWLERLLVDNNEDC